MYIDMNSTNHFYEEVLGMLNSGLTMTEIAKQITADMNNAQAAFNEAQKAHAVKARKAELVTKIYDMVQAYMNEFAPDLANVEEDREANIQNVIEGLDTFIDLAREALNVIEEAPFADEAPAPVEKDKSVTIAMRDVDAILNDWIKKLGF